MDNMIEKADQQRLGQMRDKITTIEQLVLDLRKLGGGVPVVERNARAILSFLYALKFGISDVAETLAIQKGGNNG